MDSQALASNPKASNAAPACSGFFCLQQLKGGLAAVGDLLRVQVVHGDACLRREVLEVLLDEGASVDQLAYGLVSPLGHLASIRVGDGIRAL